jgi:hypothetical protein
MSLEYTIKKLVMVSILLLICISCGAQMGKAENRQLWIDCKLEGVIPFGVFNIAVSGLQQIEKPCKKNIVSIIDFTRPSTEKRFFVIDLEQKKLLYKCLVAHGKNSGDTYAKFFSNDTESLKSSLGFFLTAETYSGTHGYALKLDGLEKNINDNARVREIVIHGADYVSDEFIKKYGILGRSWGCPALPIEISKEIIDKISGGSCLFIYSDDKYYKLNSVFLKRQ